MSRGLLLANGAAVILAAGGLTLLVKPALARRALRIADSEEATYALRIAGAMLFAASLFCAGFANMFAIASGGAG
ncbi:hypothetical protein [Stakelama tenebrarum]|uniref:Uncharacterized protein n=1 Tax=Stakelama tenebrarum TaxID=2711215 RepID=A0A6G6Y221_9SPHN|nr:hypothetical protein [Sphingosinithalassobacter tenebrarum]QIG78972.1 hypothetical protein G5C33_03675 [Sphingosinithalassobacter tenebrarum]